MEQWNVFGTEISKMSGVKGDSPKTIVDVLRRPIFQRYIQPR
jgi:hypothetical protein